jgi:hypothetical protein
MFVQSWLDTHTVLHRCQCVQSYSQWLIIFTPAEKCISSHTYILVIMALWLRSTIHSMQRDRESAHKILRMKRRRSGDGMKRDPFPPGLDALLNDLVALSSLTRLERESVCGNRVGGPGIYMLQTTHAMLSLASCMHHCMVHSHHHAGFPKWLLSSARGIIRPLAFLIYYLPLLNLHLGSSSAVQTVVVRCYASTPEP